MLPALNLRTRSTFTLLGASLAPQDIVAHAAQNDQPAIGLIDSGTLAGTYAFAKSARKAGIQPIIGSDFATPDGSVTLIAQTADGWANLLALTRTACTRSDGQVDRSALLAHAEGLALIAGHPGSALQAGKDISPEATASWIGDMLGSFSGRFFVEIDRAQGRSAAEGALDTISRQHNLPLIGTATGACANEEAHWSLEFLAAIDQGRTLDDKRLIAPLKGQHLRSQDELRKLFADAPQLLHNAAALALMCAPDAAPAARKPLLPHFPDAHGEEAAMMRQLATAGYEDRLKAVPAAQRAAYRDRLALELDIICNQGFAGYFLIVSDFISWSKRQGIPVGPGRGSGAGSAVAWALGITDLDPIRWGLLFERFINPDRVSLPDFDVDFCQVRREETIAYVRRKYGDDRVVAIGTHGTWGARSAFKDAARVLGISNGASHAASEMLPGKGGFSLTASEGEEGYLAPEVMAHFRQSDLLMRALEMAEPLQGYIRQHGRHAAGIIIADDPVASLVPVMRDPGGGSDLVTEYDMKEVEDCGLVKFDFLGLKTTTIIKEAVGHVRSLPGGDPDLDILEIPFEDDTTFDLLNEGDCQGVFQLENDGMVKALRQIAPTRFEDLIAIVSLYRPGPMENIPAYANRKSGVEPIQVPHPKLASVLQETMGIIVYQEQVMQAARLLAGYTLAEADLLRRAMGKKIQSEMDAQRSRFIEGAAKNGIPADRAGELFALIDRFAGYGFNKSHAAAYALLTWQCAWLKRHYPAAFYAATLTYDDGDFGKMRMKIREAKARGISFLPPEIGKSRVAFTPELVDGAPRAVRWGWAGVKGLGTYGHILERATYGKTYKDLSTIARDLAPHGQATIQMRALAACGALDTIDNDRNIAAEHLVECLRFHGGQQDASTSLLFDLDPPRRPKLEKQSREERRAAEIATIGISFDEHPLAEANVLRRLTDARPIRHLEELAGCGAVTLLARIDKVTKPPRSSSWLVSASDGTGDIELQCEFEPAENEIVIAEVARKNSENRWRLIDARPCNLALLPSRLSLELAASHDWEAIRSVLIAPGRGPDRVDVLVNLGERKHRRIVPACFLLTQEVADALKARGDVLAVRYDTPAHNITPTPTNIAEHA